LRLARTNQMTDVSSGDIFLIGYRSNFPKFSINTISLLRFIKSRVSESLSQLVFDQ